MNFKHFDCENFHILTYVFKNICKNTFTKPTKNDRITAYGIMISRKKQSSLFTKQNYHIIKTEDYYGKNESFYGW